MEGLNMDQVCYLLKHTDTQQEGWVKCYQVVFGADGADKVERYDAPCQARCCAFLRPRCLLPHACGKDGLLVLLALEGLRIQEEGGKRGS